MSVNPIQPGMSLVEFLGRFGTEPQCAEAIRQARWPEGFRCPRCGAAEHYVVGHGQRKLFQCNACRHQTSLTAGSVMEHSKLPLTKWLLAIYLISQAKTGLSALAMKRQLGVSCLPHRVAAASQDQQASAGRTLPVADGLMAAAALQHDLTLITRNTKDFAGLGLSLVNPWKE